MLNETLQTARLLCDFGILVLIWLVQLIVYPSFQYVAEQHFRQWHYRYTGLITLFVAPLMFGQVLLYALEIMFHGWHWIVAVNLPLIAIAWLATALLSVPCHDRMQKRGYDKSVISRLVNTNWIRTFVWTAVFALDAVDLITTAA